MTVSNILETLDAFVSSSMERWHTPGLAVAIVQNGEILLTRGFGERNLEHKQSVTPETRFAIGSCTKAFTATALAMLVDEGKLDWDKPVRDYLPTFQLYDSYATIHATTRDLLTHRVGLPRHDLLWYTSALSRAELVARLRYLEPTREFRQTWQYQNLLYMTAGHLLEVITGQSWESFIQERIFTPLGMNASCFDAETARASVNCATPYKEASSGVATMDWYPHWHALGPAGSIHTNVLDMSQWLLLHLQQGTYKGQKLLSQAQMREMHTPHVSKPEPRKYSELFFDSYALGWAVTAYRGHTLIRHGGNIDGFSAQTAFLPDEQAGVVVLTNHNSGPLQSIVAYYILDCLLGVEPIDWHERAQQEYHQTQEEKSLKTRSRAKDKVLSTKPSHTRDAYTGVFEHPGYGLITITDAGENLQLRYNELLFTLHHYHYDSFEMQSENFDPNMDILCTFLTDELGRVTSCNVQFEATQPALCFVRNNQIGITPVVS
ncbi:serine hydrolase [Ktedonospora formicarum]|uniref:Penicillin-binding protein n=1 Tax=Ktedonospora formicarum TaxID=2778364 RepID=A0A8J3I3M3_9CHLR|nr:serine hydrolase [Ktedonospora formicarum]GHO45577.1 penicillin-binding protein [Ktedonospora formicarum]